MQKNVMHKIKRTLLLLALVFWAVQAAAVRVGVLLPLKERSPLGQMMLEFYRGLLLAVDSVKNQGLSVEVYTLDSGTTEASLREALAGGSLRPADLIFGPGVPEQAEALAAYCRQQGIRLVMPFNTPCATLATNPYVFQAMLPQEALYEAAVQLTLESLADAHFVLLRCGEADDRAASFQSALAERLQAYGLPHSVLNVQADAGAVVQALSITRNNLVIPDSRSEAALERMAQQLNAFRQTHPNYRFSLLGYPDWLAFATRRSELLFACDTYLFTPFYANPLSGRTIRFAQRYEQDFRSPLLPLLPSPAMTGFDLGYHFLHGVNPQPLQQDFDFQPVAEQGGQANCRLQLVHFASNKLIQVIR